MSVYNALRPQVLSFNKLNQFIYFFRLITSRIENDAFLLIVNYKGVFSKIIKAKHFYVGHVSLILVQICFYSYQIQKLDLKRYRNIDFILVGQGIAGSILAHQLMVSGKKILVFDTPEKNQSSLVAAGLFNPITGRRFVKTWKADLLFPYLIQYYSKLESVLKSVFLHQLPIFRPFLTIEEKNEMISKTNPEELGLYVDQILHVSPENLLPINDLGGLLVKNSGYLDIPGLTNSMKEFIRANGSFRNETFQYGRLEFHGKGIRYMDFAAEKIIFCEGSHVVDNPFFSALPFRPVKGEILLIDPEIQLNFIFNRKIFILPLQNGLYKVGSTYNHDFQDVNPTLEAKRYIEEKLIQVLPVKYNVIEHRAGIRPATRDRRPIIGMHPDFPSVGIFNGLGSKGVTLAPYFAKQFVGYLLKDEDLDKEVNIKRFY